MSFNVKGFSKAVVRIYTVGGRLVKEIQAGDSSNMAVWDGDNEKKETVKLGIYIYTITDSKGNRKTGKFAVK